MREPRVGDGRPRRRRIAAALWLIAAALGWVLLAGVARVPSPGAARLTSVLFVVALPLTYCAILGAAIRASARPRQAVLPAAAVTLGFVLGLGLLELSAAAGLVDWDRVFVSLKRGPELYVPDPELGFRHPPNSRWSGRPRSDIPIASGLRASTSDRLTITYDSRGYRNATPLSRADIVLIGDSMVEGWHVSDDQIVSAFLQARLGRPVANLGVAGYGTAQELIVLTRDAVPLEPKDSPQPIVPSLHFTFT